MKNLFKIIIQVCLCVGLAWAAWSCKDKKEPQPDPCTLITPFEADFKIQMDFIDTLAELDEFIQGNAIQFTASEDYDEYLWTLQDDDHTWNTKSFGLTFVNDAHGRFYVRLIAKRHTDCESNPVQIDTITKSFTVHYFRMPPFVPLAEATPLPFLGKFRGAFLDVPDEVFTIEIFANNAFTLYLYNFPNQCGNNFSYPFILSSNYGLPTLAPYSYTAFGYGSRADANVANCISTPRLYGTMNEAKDELTLSYKLSNGSRRIFRGTKQ